MNKARKADWKNTCFVAIIIICFFIIISGQPISSAADFDAEVQDVWLYPSEINQGDSADVKIKVKNLADYDNGYNGYGTYDIRIRIWKPGGGYNGYYWNNYELSYHQIKTFKKSNYLFDESGTYTIKGEVYDINGYESGWDTSHRFDYRTEYFDAVPKGNLRVRCYEHYGSSLEADTIVVYDDSGEVDRTYDKNTYTFTDLDEDVYYVEIYEMNNLVDLETGISVEGGQTTTVDMYANEQVTLNVYAYYDDHTTPYPTADVRIMSWDGYNGEWDTELNYQSLGSDGHRSFDLYPTTQSGEKFRIIVFETGNINDVAHDEEFTITGDDTISAYFDEEAPTIDTISFSGYTWNVRPGSESPQGPGGNYWSNSTGNIWVDEEGQLHLKITYRNGKWDCPEIYSQETFGYGKYYFFVSSRVDELDKNVVGGLFTYEGRGETTPKEYEIDIEFSRWGVETNENALHVFQYRIADGNPATDDEPNEIDPNRFDISLSGEYSTHTFVWKNNYLYFQSYHGRYDDLPSKDYLISEKIWEDPRIPPESDEKVHLNLWLVNGNPPSDGQSAEMIVKEFKFIPPEEPKPDLTITRIWFSKNPCCAGDDVEIIFDVKNQGNDDAGAHKDCLLIDGFEVKEFSSSGLKAGKTQGWYYLYENVPSTPDPHVIDVCTDCYDEVVESDEYNNCDNDRLYVDTPDISVDHDHLDFECCGGVGSLSMSVKLNDIDSLSCSTYSMSLNITNDYERTLCGCNKAEEGIKIGVRNPAAVYCTEMDYEYKIEKTENGERGICVMPNNEECDAWAFYTGECGREFSYCAKMGWSVAPKGEKDSFATNCTTCVLPDGSRKTVSKLLKLSEKCAVGMKKSNNAGFSESEIVERGINLPGHFDWRNKDGENWMTSVKNQGYCGSCWAFSAVGIVEPVYNIFYENPNLDLDLSEEYLVSDCSSAGTCCGGGHDQALNFIKENGITDEACFPYVDASGCTCSSGTCDTNCNYRTGGACSDATCSDRCYDWSNRLKKIDETGSVSSNIETIKENLIEKGPLSVAMDWGAGYWDGDIRRCSGSSDSWHAIALTGYNDAGGYWILKNSWGPSWEDEGYFKVGYGECSIENYVDYAILTTGENCKTITVSNEGDADLVVDDITVYYQAGEPTGWLDANPKALTVSPGGSKPVSVCVDCTGLSPDEYHGWLNIRSNDPDEDPYQVTVTLTKLNQHPTAIIDSVTPDPAEQGTDTVSFTGHGTDSDGSVVAYNWRSSIDGQLSTSASFSKPASDLSIGTHTIYFKVQDDDGAWSTEDTEDLTINPASEPELSYSPTSHDFGDKCEGETDSTTFEIWNSGTGTLSYTLSEICGWVDVHPTSGSSTGEHDAITVDIDTTGLSEGSHTCDISISSNGGSGTFTVTVNVVPCPELSYSPSSHNFGDKCEGETDSTTFEIWNPGTGTLSYTLSESCSWVNVHPTSGSSTGEHDTITVDIDTTGLSVGSHTCYIFISSNGGSGTFTVTVNVIPCEAPKLCYSPTSHDFGDKCEGETDSTTFEVWNSGTGTLTYSLSKSGSWVEVNPTSGSSTGEHDTITVDIDTAGLSEGSHTCDISISSNGGTGTFTVRVNIVPKPDLIITEKWLCWPDSCTICYNVTNIGDGPAPACHNTTLYVEGVEVAHDHVPVDLAPGESYTGCFDGYEWTYTPPSDNITVCADNNEILDELDENNNCLTNIWMCGDVNCDGKVTMSDVRKVFNRYLDPNYPLDSPWAADVNCDGKVTMSDVRKVFNRYLDPGYVLNCCCGSGVDSAWVGGLKIGGKKKK